MSHDAPMRHHTPMTHHAAATVAGVPVLVREVDAREAELRAGPIAAALPRPGTSEGRQLRRWLTQLLVTDRVVAFEVAVLGLTTQNAPGEDEVLPDAAARLEVGSVAATALADPRARNLFAHVTAEIDVSDAEVADYHARNPFRFAQKPRCDSAGWRTQKAQEGNPPPLNEVRDAIADHLRAAARRRAFRVWLDARRAALVELTPGYEHPGDPRQPDNTHKH